MFVYSPLAAYLMLSMTIFSLVSPTVMFHVLAVFRPSLGDGGPNHGDASQPYEPPSGA